MVDSVEPRDRLIHIADLHFWEIVWNPLRLMSKRLIGNFNVVVNRRRRFIMDRAEEHADAVAATGATQVLLTGDFTSTSLDVEFEMARAFVEGLAQRGVHPHVLPGNHDVYTFAAERQRRFEKHFAAFLPEGGYPARVVLPGGTPLLLIPTVQANPLSARGDVKPETLERVRALLDACGEGPVVAASHYPLLPRTAAYVSSFQRQLGRASALRDVLGSARRPLVHVAGHVHRFSYVQDAAFSMLRHLTTGAFFRTGLDGREGEFSEIRVTDIGFQVLHHICRAGWARRARQPGGPQDDVP